MSFDHESFVVGIQVGRRLKVADAMRELPPKPPVISGSQIVTEDGYPIVSESGQQLVTEVQGV